jgi:hypothetical protein
MRTLTSTSVLLTLLVSALPALGQSRVGWEIFGGGTLPLSAYVQNGIRQSEGLSNLGEEQLIPRLVDQYNSTGFQIGSSFVIDRLEFGYSFHEFGWDKEVTVCSGLGAAAELSGEIDDTTVAYDCSETAIRESDVSAAGLEPVLLHVFSAGYRFPLAAVEQSVNGFVVFAPGVALSTYDDSEADTTGVFGLHLSAGLGADIPLSETLTIALQGRYNLLLSAPSGTTQEAANRAQARGQSALSAVVTAFDYIALSLGLRLDFR